MNDDRTTIPARGSNLNRPLADLIAELRVEMRQRDAQTLAELAALRELIDDFARTVLNSLLPFGKPDDRWSRRG